MKKLSFLIFFLAFIMGFSQFYKPIDTADYTQRKIFLKKYAALNEKLISSYKAKYPGKTGTELKKRYTEFQTEFEKNVLNKDFIFASAFESRISAILKDLKKNNTLIPEDLTVLVAKDNTPNAYCLADGTFVINMGIFSWLDNEDQIAAVMSHELAHLLLEHSLKSVISSVSENEHDKNRFTDLKNVKINKKDQAFSIVKNRVYKKGFQSRKYEIQADSLGYEIYKNSDFKKQEYLNAYRNLQKYDTISPVEVSVETYRKLYSLPNLAFKEKWLKKEDFSLYNYNLYQEKLAKDSTASHPEVEMRLKSLTSLFPELRKEEKAKEGSSTFGALRTTARMEILPNFYHDEEYGVGIYSAMQFLQMGEEEVYYKKWLGTCFLKIAEARKNYNLNRYLDRVDPKNQSESYQLFLNFMWNLNVEDIENIAAFYNKS